MNATMKMTGAIGAMAMAIAILLAGCGEKPGPMEKAGAAVDRAAEKTAEATGRAIEKTGEALEKTGEAVEKTGTDMQP